MIVYLSNDFCYALPDILGADFDKNCYMSI